MEQLYRSAQTGEGVDDLAQVALDDVTKAFGGVTAVHGVTLDVHDGEFLVLLGPSGCGKTTTLRMVAGLEEVSSGRIRIEGRDVTDVPPKGRDIAMVFQNYALYPHMSVFDNMAFGLKLRKMPSKEIHQRVTRTAESLGLQSFLSRKPKALSGGQRQRVALGRAIVREPAAFLMDEPLSNLDARLRDQTRVELKSLHQRLGTTTLYVTHDQTEAMTLGTRIVVMRHGQIQQVDTPEAIYQRPANQFVATFVGTPAMNLFPGKVTLVEGKPALGIGQQLIRWTPQVPLHSQANRQVTVGVRPEDCRIRASGQGQGLKASVTVVEPMGHETLIYCTVEGHSLTVRADNQWGGRVGDMITLDFVERGVHLFDSQTEQRLN